MHVSKQSIVSELLLHENSCVDMSSGWCRLVSSDIGLHEASRQERWRSIADELCICCFLHSLCAFAVKAEEEPKPLVATSAPGSTSFLRPSAQTLTILCQPSSSLSDFFFDCVRLFFVQPEARESVQAAQYRINL
jgi:hypothetical protein